MGFIEDGDGFELLAEVVEGDEREDVAMDTKDGIGDEEDLRELVAAIF